jgi:transaldolase
MDYQSSTELTLERITADDLRIKVFADGADLDGILRLNQDPLIQGFTTNPTLMRKSGISDYEAFARQVLEVVADKPISFEVFSDDPDEMVEQARRIAAWGENVYVKIPVTNTEARRCDTTIGTLAAEGVKLNVTGLMTPQQVAWVTECLEEDVPAVISVFAGRVADAGYDPVPLMTESLKIIAEAPQAELLWASPREILNIVQANQIGCHIITVTHDLLKKLSGLGRDLDEFSLDTVKMFRDDAVAAGYRL